MLYMKMLVRLFENGKEPVKLSYYRSLAYLHVIILDTI